jgi:guanylate kinase
MLQTLATPALFTMALLYPLLTRSSAFHPLIRPSRKAAAAAPHMVVSSFDRTRRRLTSHDGGDSPKPISPLDPLIVCGPSGVGKGTIIQKYMEQLGGRQHFGFTVSHTTRPPRDGEVNGVHYHFVDHDEMNALLADNYFLEYARVHGNWYGTSWKAMRDVQAGNKRCLMDIDVQGVQRIKTLEEPSILQPRYIFIAPPSIETLKERLRGRGSESPETLQRRVGSAVAEVQYGLEGNFDVVVTNDDLEKAVRDFDRAVRDLYNVQ